MNLSNKTISLVFFNTVNTGAQFCLYIILSRYYSTTDYASFRQTFLLFEMAAPILGLGLTTSIFYFYPRFNDKKALLIKLLLLVFFSSILFVLSFLLGAGQLLSHTFNNPVLKNTFFYTGIFSFFSLANAILYSFYILSERYTYIVWCNLLCNALFIAFVFMFSFYHYDIKVMIELRVVSYALLFISMFFPLKINFSLIRSQLKFSDLKAILQYSVPISLSAQIGILAYQMDNFLVGTLCTVDQYAIYTNGAIEIPFITVITSSISAASFAGMALFCKELKFKEALVLFKKISLASAFLIFPLFGFCMAFSKQIIVFVFSEKYTDSYYIFSAYLLLLPIRIIYYGNTLTALGKTKALLFRSIIELLINGISCILLFKIFGFFGIAFANVISVCGWSVPYNLVTISKGFGVSVFKVLPFKKLSILMICCLISVSCCYLLNPLLNQMTFSPLVYLLANMTIYASCYFIVSYFFRVYGYDKRAVLKFKLL
jgi:O-antigen/teichoic acid export membrane protein